MDFFSRFKPKPRKRTPQVGIIYVLHFERPYKHARHYVGWTSKDEIDERLEQHLTGRGSPLVKAVIAAGIEVTVAATMPGTRDMERHLKNRHDNRGVCPTCRQEWLARKKMKKVAEMTLGEVRQLIRTVLRESVCPGCGGRGAYIGLNTVECPNKACPHFSVKQLQAGQDSGVKAIELDWADEPGEPSTWQGKAQEYGLSAEQVRTDGFPVIRFTGPEENIKNLIDDYSQGGEDPSFYYDEIEDA